MLRNHIQQLTLDRSMTHVQRDLRAAKDMACSSAAHAAGAQADHEELQQLQVPPPAPVFRQQLNRPLKGQRRRKVTCN